MGVIAGGASGTLFGGLFYDRTGAYGWLWIGLFALPALAGMLSSP